jgi:hypothetical protein
VTGCKSNICYCSDPRGWGRVGSSCQILPVIVSPSILLDRILSYSVHDFLTCWHVQEQHFLLIRPKGGGAGRGQKVKHCQLLYLLLNCLTDFFHIRYMTSSHCGGVQEQHLFHSDPKGAGQGKVKRSNIVCYCILLDFFHIRFMTSLHDGGMQEQHFVLF